MNGGEHVRVFHPDGGQVVDVEKTAVIDFIRRHSPEAQAIGLIVKEAFQAIETVWIAFGAVDGSQHLGAELF